MAHVLFHIWNLLKTAKKRRNVSLFFDKHIPSPSILPVSFSSFFFNTNPFLKFIALDLLDKQIIMIIEAKFET